jgi:hypothetical protein
MAQYKVGLKPFLKQELLRKDKPESLANLIKLAVKINNRFYEYRLVSGTFRFKQNLGKKAFYKK